MIFWSGVVRVMKVGPSQPPGRGRLQTTVSCVGSMPGVVSVTEKARLDRVRWGSGRRAEANHRGRVESL